jgi:hypothetical protein
MNEKDPITYDAETGELLVLDEREAAAARMRADAAIERDALPFHMAD